MGFEEFLDMCPHTITLESFTSRDGFGNATYSAPVTLRARVQGKPKAIRTQNGIEATSTVQVYLGPTPVVTPDDRITLPSFYQKRSPPILSVEPDSDESGQHHQVIYA